MSKLKITKGKAEVFMSEDGFCDVRVDGKVKAFVGVDSNSAYLIADAFNTANETDKLPSEIRQERDAALRLLGDFCNHLQSIDYETVVVLTEKEEFTIRQAKELINKIENNE